MLYNTNNILEFWQSVPNHFLLSNSPPISSWPWLWAWYGSGFPFLVELPFSVVHSSASVFSVQVSILYFHLSLNACLLICRPALLIHHIFHSSFTSLTFLLPLCTECGSKLPCTYTHIHTQMQTRNFIRRYRVDQGPVWFLCGCVKDVSVRQRFITVGVWMKKQSARG